MRLSLYTTLAVLACSVQAVKLSTDIDLGLYTDVEDKLPVAGKSLLGVPVGGATKKHHHKGEKSANTTGGCPAIPSAGVVSPLAGALGGVGQVGLGGMGMGG